MRDRSLWRASQGVVYVEFLLVFPPLLVLFLVILQSAILRVDDLGVRHAASASVRAAIVVLPDDPSFYGGQPVNQLSAGACGKPFEARVEKLLGRDARPPAQANRRCSGGARLAAIQFAAIARMLPFGPNARRILSLASTGSPTQASRISGAATYSYGATAVTVLEGGPGQGASTRREKSKRSFGAGTDVTVQVRYLAHCGIPIARFLMCETGLGLAANGDIASERAIRRSMGERVGSSEIFTALMASGARFRVLTAEATLPLNDAPYDYQPKD